MNTLDEFRKEAGDLKILDRPAEREMYSHDIGDLPPAMVRLFDTMPGLVIQPETTEQIGRILAIATRLGIPVVPRGAASWGFGGVVPARGGIVIDLSPFRSIGAINRAEKTVTVEAGARWADIDTLARNEGLCLMAYPSSKFSTVGGWISTGGYGINSFRYGHLSKHIAAMTVVTPSGQVKKLSPSDPEFASFISTEGELGIVSEITLKLRDVPCGSYTRLLYFPSDREAFAFIRRFAGAVGPDMNPNVIRFLDENHLGDINQIMRSDVFEKKAAVLLEFGTPEEESCFSTYLSRSAGTVEEAPRYAASLLWNERLFGMKTKRLGPSLLASEVIMPVSSTAKFIGKAKRIGRHFGVEVCVDSYIIDKDRALVMATFLCDSRTSKYYIKLPLVEILTKAAVMLGGEPYGLGLWNAAFLHNRYSKDELRRLKAYKDLSDPGHIMNPGKFFGVGSKGASRLIFHPAFFGPAMRAMVFMAPVIGRTATLFLGKEGKVDRLDYELSLHACAKCGNCMAVCPAYLVTQNEAVTAKGKIALARKILAGKPVTREEAVNAFMCMRCRACERICQTNLELTALWDALEKRLQDQFGWPETEIAEYLKEVDASSQYWEMVEHSG